MGGEVMQVTMDEAYAEACRALGESVVRERLLVAEVQRLGALVPQEQPRQHAGTISDPDPRPPMGESRVQHA